MPHKTLQGSLCSSWAGAGTVPGPHLARRSPGWDVCSHRCPGCLMKLLENAMSCQVKLLEDTIFLLLLSGTWCLCLMQLLWGKETSRAMTKFVYDQNSFTGLGDYFTVQSCLQGNSLHVRIHSLPRGFNVVFSCGLQPLHGHRDKAVLNVRRRCGYKGVIPQSPAL